MPGQECFCIGKFIKTHGTKGELVLKASLELPEEFEKTEFVFVEIDGGQVPFFISGSGIQIRSAYSAIVGLGDVSSEPEARELVGCSVSLPVKFANLFAKKELDVTSLVGFMIISQSNEAIGEIEEITGIPKNPLFSVPYHGKKILLPYRDELISNIDLEKRIITLIIPDGLLDL